MKHTISFSRHAQSGQVLVWFLGFAASLAVVFAGVYSVGQATSEKQKIVNAADAAAYSGGLTEARALNLASYTNRSVIANEVLIAQMVSLDSWASYFKEATNTYENLFKVLKNIPYFQWLAGFEITMKALNEIVKPIDNRLNTIVPATIVAWEGIYGAWYNATIKTAFTPPVMALAATSAARAVLANNVASHGGRFDSAPRLLEPVSFGLANERAWQNLIKRYEKTGRPGTASDDRRYVADLLLNSRDSFSTNRPGSDNFLWKPFFGSSKICARPFILVGSEKQGPTKLVSYERWEAQDTVEFRFRLAPTSCSWGKGSVAAPEGWGRSTADKNGRNPGNRLDTPGGAGALAYRANHANGRWTGVKELYDVDRNPANGIPIVEESSFVVSVAKPSAAIKNNESLGFVARPMSGPTGSPDLKTGFAKDQIGAVSEARVFFSRPARNAQDITAGNLFRADRHQEYASLYNPYWQVRLRTSSNVNRIAAYALNGLNPALIPFAQ